MNFQTKDFSALTTGCARRETRTLKRQFSTASETATFTNFAIRALHVNGLLSALHIQGCKYTFFNQNDSYKL